MARRYEDLSRRALIKLGSDYDDANEGKLLLYLAEHDKEYEGIRPVEKAIQSADQVKETLKYSGGVLKQTIAREADRLLDKIVDGLANMASNNV